MLDKALALARSGRIAEAEAAYAKLLAAKKPRPQVLQAAVLFHLRYSRRFRKALPLVAAPIRPAPMRLPPRPSPTQAS